MKRAIVWIVTALLTGAVLAYGSERLFSYEMQTLRARRVEIADEQGRIRVVLTVHRNRPAVIFVDEAGNPMPPVFVPEAGVLMAPGLE